ncbi:phage Gp37/Gp68 family protein [Roseicitreum antarcticum]|uniref:Protein gp37 n=1 Tax=Roseicitreum antarcticum TaxID=564137 RepID=A0A1H3G2Z2_9RHOB|nr:phage Gp37/Gp68 family protein [Roseicitreum antarcticum]SDX96804.1 protein gp37 [Roseicitreum antarcticum]
MAENSKIEWTHHTFNPWEGCQKVGPGCDHCYAEARDQRFTGGAHWGPGAPRRRTSAANWRKPLAWDRAAQAASVRRRVFCASLADVFDNAVDPQWRADLWELIGKTPNLDWLLLTKRPGNIAGMLPEVERAPWGELWPWSNVWLGCTVVNQAEADRDIPKLLAVDAAVRFLSMEPLLGPVDLTRPEFGGTYCAVNCRTMCIAQGDEECPKNSDPALDWVIVGGESGPGARPMHPDWARSLRDQCEAAGVAFFFKQWGEYESDQIGREDAQSASFPPGHVIFRKVGKRTAGRKLDGRTWDQMPGMSHD